MMQTGRVGVMDSVGETSRLVQREGERKESWSLVAGVRIAF
jgi:uncharacterized protein involved in copper resistance